MTETPRTSKWASRFIAAAIAQGALATALTVYLVLGQLSFMTPAFSKVIAGGGAGIWFTVGYATYLIVGVLAVAVTALFYHYIEAILRKTYTGAANLFAWLHLILMNVGVVGGTWLMMLGGYLGGAAMMSKESGGLGWNVGQVHTNIFYGIPFGYPVWISAFILVLALGVLLGGLGYVLTWAKKS